MKFSYTIPFKLCWFIALISRIAVVCIGVLFLPLILSAASLRIEGERAWLKADHMPLAEVLRLFEQRGVEVLIDPSIKLRPISGDWENTEVGWLITQLTSPHSSIIEWKLEKSHLGDLFQLSSIRIFPVGQPSAARPLSSPGKVLDVVESENGIQYIRGEILVGFNQESTIEDLNALLRRLDGTVIEAMHPPGIYRIKFNDDMHLAEARRIAQSHDGVNATEPNLVFPAIVSQILPLTDAVDKVNLNLLPVETTIAVLDSGLDPAYADLPYIRGAYDALDPKAEISDSIGHGTLTALIAAGAITPLGANAAKNGVPVFSIRIFDLNGLTSSATIMRALEYAANSGAKIVSMSWGSTAASHFLETAMNFAAQNGMKLYAAAGNEPTGIPVYPAGYDSVMAVGGLNPDGSRWRDSNYGGFVEHYEPAFANFNNRSYAGTSIASPYAAFKAAHGELEE
jgi:thermitase